MRSSTAHKFLSYNLWESIIDLCTVSVMTALQKRENAFKLAMVFFVVSYFVCTYLYSVNILRSQLQNFNLTGEVYPIVISVLFYTIAFNFYGVISHSLCSFVNLPKNKRHSKGASEWSFNTVVEFLFILGNPILGIIMLKSLLMFNAFEPLATLTLSCWLLFMSVSPILAISFTYAINTFIPSSGKVIKVLSPRAYFQSSILTTAEAQFRSMTVSGSKTKERLLMLDVASFGLHAEPRKEIDNRTFENILSNYCNESLISKHLFVYTLITTHNYYFASKAIIRFGLSIAQSWAPIEVKQFLSIYYMDTEDKKITLRNHLNNVVIPQLRVSEEGQLIDFNIYLTSFNFLPFDYINDSSELLKSLSLKSLSMR